MQWRSELSSSSLAIKQLLLFQLQVCPACQAGEGGISGNLSDSALGSKAPGEKLIKALNKK